MTKAKTTANVKIHDRIRASMDEIELTGRALEREAGFEHGTVPTTLKRLLNDEAYTPSIKTISRIALATGQSVDWLLFGDAAPSGALFVKARTAKERLKDGAALLR